MVRESDKDRLCRFLHSPWFSVAMLGVFFTLGLTLDFAETPHHAVSEPLERKGIVAMSGLLAQRLEADDPQVVVIDASKIRRVRPAGRSQTAIDREQTLKLIERLVAEKATAIGLDVDVSPFRDDPKSSEPAGWVVGQFAEDGTSLTSDEEFFGRLQPISKTRPIALGVYRSSSGTPDQWLGNRAFANMAAHVWVSVERPEDAAGKQSVGSARLPSMAEVLVGKRLSPQRPRRWLYAPDFSAIATGPELGPPGSASQRRDGVELRVVQPAFLKKVQKNTFVYTPGMKSFPIPVDGKIVMIGYTKTDGHDADVDTFDVPPFGKVRGVYLHAMAIESYLYGGFDKVGSWGSALLDTLLGVFLVAAVHLRKVRRFLAPISVALGAVVGLLFWSPVLGLTFALLGLVVFVSIVKGNEKKVEALLSLLAISTVALLGTYLSLDTRILWPGFIAVVLAKITELVVHAGFHRFLCPSHDRHAIEEKHVDTVVDSGPPAPDPED